MSGLMGSKIGMTRILKADGIAVPVSVIRTGPNQILHKKTAEKDGYLALVLGFEPLKTPKKTKKYRYIKEFSINSEEFDQFEKGSAVDLNIFKEGEKITLSSVSKGKGFAGVMKKWNFSGGPATHGCTRHRGPGSIGARAKPGRIEKGKKLPGRLGNEKVTIKSEIVMINQEKGLIAVKGAVPGAKNSLVILKKS
ncbi:50S ribosomal protein L3 [Candidatus Peregrinibacteria bacterium RIFOXYB2_FULL_32_7]|nr:MAG: 50S ribosomal protein L3 [Candidatus Peregrinibacteria bacterium RIFOXYB2_FULL_32_7]